MKSKQLRTLLANLSELNNSFTHYSFVWNQFSIDYQDLIENNPNDLTKDIFKANPFATKHNIKLEKFTKEHNKTYKALIEGIYLLIYSYYEDYLKSIMDFACSVDEVIKPLSEKLKDTEEKLEDTEDDYLLIDKVINRTGIDKMKIHPEELLTLDYLRLRRNRITHRNSKRISHSLNEIIKNEGKKLNEYWAENLRTGLQEMDFHSKDKANIINFDYIIDTVNILRVIFKNVDQQILETLGKEKIIKKVVIPDFLEVQGNRIKQLTKERLLRKFKRFSKSEYAINTNDVIEREFIEAI